MRTHCCIVMGIGTMRYLSFKSIYPSVCLSVYTYIQVLFVRKKVNLFSFAESCVQNYLPGDTHSVYKMNFSLTSSRNWFHTQSFILPMSSNVLCKSIKLILWPSTNSLSFWLRLFLNILWRLRDEYAFERINNMKDMLPC